MSQGREIFLDHAATTPLHPEALGLMLPYFGNHFGTPSMPHTFGEKPRAAVAQARMRLAGLINASPHEIVFTSSGTQANNLAILGPAWTRGRTGHIVTSAIEHPSVHDSIEHLRKQGFTVTVISPDNQGRISPEDVAEAVQDDTFLVSVMHASGETGAVQNAEDIGHIARERGVVFHCDCVQSAGKIPIDVNSLNADLLSISSHILYGPKGVGALYVRQGTPIAPIMFGDEQGEGLCPGNLNIPGIVGFGLACERARTDREKHASYISSLRNALEQDLRTRIPGITIHSSGVERTPHISTISFEGIRSDALAAWLDLAGITVSERASFSSRGSSQALGAMGIPADLAFGTVRFSPGWENSMEEIRLAADAVTEAVVRIRDFSRNVGDEPVCILTFSSKNHVDRSLKCLEEAGIPCTVTARPVELDHVSGPRIALAIPCPCQDEAGRVLGSHNITMTGMHRLWKRL